MPLVMTTVTTERFGCEGCMDLDEPLDLVSTLESGQTFLWSREDQEMFSGHAKSAPVFTTARVHKSGEVMVLRVGQDDDGLFWESTHSDAEEYVREVFRLNENYQQIHQAIIENDPNGVIEEAIEEFRGLRVVNEPLFPTLISFLCSPQIGVEHIHEMVQKLSAQYGDSVVIAGHEYSAFPSVHQLTGVTEDELKELKLGYRAEYVAETVTAIDSSSLPLETLHSNPADARSHLQEYHGVGPKVVDCVLLYGDGRDSIVPVDTRIAQAVEEYYPEYTELSREEAARELEDLFGEYAGHAQLYLYHYWQATG